MVCIGLMWGRAVCGVIFGGAARGVSNVERLSEPHRPAERGC
jgi:hypothetical protein